ncbi:hypothetical protein [Terribacillus saccharophilus]|uniref:hypothetical protein n=1 Tax=Terribacillus saccharophilus TaxID=361277 RepID=UPI002989FDCA|nr:hypothetical protein [Terribacillus saccharophilus]MCM3227567.1 hypothetical protein [Terribacillus saccharophilus]
MHNQDTAKDDFLESLFEILEKLKEQYERLLRRRKEGQDGADSIHESLDEKDKKIEGFKVSMQNIIDSDASAGVKKIAADFMNNPEESMKFLSTVNAKQTHTLAKEMAELTQQSLDAIKEAKNGINMENPRALDNLSVLNKLEENEKEKLNKANEILTNSNEITLGNEDTRTTENIVIPQTKRGDESTIEEREISNDERLIMKRELGDYLKEKEIDLSGYNESEIENGMMYYKDMNNRYSVTLNHSNGEATIHQYWVTDRAGNLEQESKDIKTFNLESVQKQRYESERKSINMEAKTSDELTKKAHSIKDQMMRYFDTLDPEEKKDFKQSGLLFNKASGRLLLKYQSANDTSFEKHLSYNEKTNTVFVSNVKSGSKSLAFKEVDYNEIVKNNEMKKQERTKERSNENERGR